MQTDIGNGTKRIARMPKGIGVLLFTNRVTRVAKGVGGMRNGKRRTGMTDLVERQAVLDILKDKWNLYLYADDAIQASIDKIKVMPSVTPTDQWIIVKDRLPEKWDYYLVTYQYGDEICTMEAKYICMDGADYWFDETDVEITLAVTAWMPKPKPYKTESEDNK